MWQYEYEYSVDCQIVAPVIMRYRFNRIFENNVINVKLKRV